MNLNQLIDCCFSIFPLKMKGAVLSGLCLFSVAELTAQETGEKKVDYLERIYFSGKNKAELNVEILVALQEMQGKQPSEALAKQVTYLLDIQDEANEASNSCEILDLLAVGIYNIDALEGSKQGVKPASDKAKKKTVDAVASIQKLGSTSTSLSGSARNLQWSSYLLSGGNYSKFSQGAGKLANTAGQAGAVLGTVGEAGKAAEQIGGIMKSAGINPFKKKDQPCNEIKAKEIEISPRPVLMAAAAAPATDPAVKQVVAVSSNNKTLINLQGASNALLKTLTEALRTKEGITSVDKTYSETLSTITVNHSTTTGALADWLEETFPAKLTLKNYDGETINLVAKSGK